MAKRCELSPATGCGDPKVSTLVLGSYPLARTIVSSQALLASMLNRLHNSHDSLAIALSAGTDQGVVGLHSLLAGADYASDA